MKIIETRIEGLLIFEPDVYQDNRGDFFESYNDSVYKDFGFKEVFVQENQSYSVQNVIRGLHYQVGKNAQGKLARVAFGKYFSIELSQMNKLQFWIPPGFAHGLSVLSKEAVFIYKCTKPFSKTDERSIRFNDPDLQIDWEIFDPIVSDKDEQAPSFQEAINELIT